MTLGPLWTEKWNIAEVNKQIKDGIPLQIPKKRPPNYTHAV